MSHCLVDQKIVRLTEFRRHASARPVRPMMQAKAMMKIESGVFFLLKSDKPAFEFGKRDTSKAYETSVGKRLEGMLDLIGFFDYGYDYSEAPTLFMTCLKEVEKSHGHVLTGAAYKRPEYKMVRASVMNVLVDRMRQEAKSKWYTRYTSDRAHQSSENAKSISEYTSALLQERSKTLIVRLDHGYASGVNANVTIRRVIDDMHQFMSYRSHYPEFYGLVGYAWSVRQSRRHGFHIHACYFFDGSKIRRDIVKGFMLGALWQQTSGFGTFHNCNRRKGRYSRLGIGMIRRDDAVACENAVHALQYLAKGGDFSGADKEYLRIWPESQRTFFRGLA